MYKEPGDLITIRIELFNRIEFGFFGIAQLYFLTPIPREL